MRKDYNTPTRGHTMERGRRDNWEHPEKRKNIKHSFGSCEQCQAPPSSLWHVGYPRMPPGSQIRCSAQATTSEKKHLICLPTSSKLPCSNGQTWAAIDMTSLAHHRAGLLEVLQYIYRRSNSQLGNDQLHIRIHPAGASLYLHNQNNVGDQHHRCLGALKTHLQKRRVIMSKLGFKRKSNQTTNFGFELTNSLVFL